MHSDILYEHNSELWCFVNGRGGLKEGMLVVTDYIEHAMIVKIIIGTY